MSSPHKRQLRPSVSSQSTAEVYFDKHGIQEDLQPALLNIGRRIRQAVATNARTLQPTQSLPVAFSGSPHIFLSDRDTATHAQEIINKEVMRSRELQPYASSSSVDFLALSPRRPAERSASGTLRFTPDGEVKLDRGTKRRGDDDGHDDAGAGSDTDVDDDDQGGENESIVIAPLSVSHDFPPVFLSNVPDSGATQDEPARMGPPPIPAFRGFGGASRATRGLPRRPLAKTMSAPVGRLGTWAGTGMDVDGFDGRSGDGDDEGGEEEFDPTKDGFDVADWAKSEEF